MAKENWGRWGPEDEAGTLNLITPDKVTAAAGLVSVGRVLSLAQPLSSATPMARHRHGFAHFMDRDGGDYAAGGKRPGGFQFAEDTIMMPVHTGTHIDALCHAWYDDRLYNEFSGDSIRSTKGGQFCGIDKMPPLFTRGILLDAVAQRGEVFPPGETITLNILKAALSATGREIEPGDVVLIRTGWLESHIGRTGVSLDTEPGIDVEGAEWLAESGVAALGADNFAIETIPFPAGAVFPVHQRLIRDYGMPLLEGLVLAPLAKAGAKSFLFSAAPIPIVGGTGSPLAPIAVL
ncbi:cyclase family protein [Marivibrio halodurans]|uniref:Cyclase family protein n=1 Tax=Marivibrio halodurans TaxID=2039722 RepID=A0A8J7S4E0_9PROT|nr:cyclase family protein [Marivibrio halodurans]MBP5858554.1 cyclase family protein [Marivibrio halodurans]